MKKRATTLILLMCTAGCAKNNGPEQTMLESKKETKESAPTQTWIEAFETAFNNGDAKAIGEMYASDAAWTMANGVELQASQLEQSLAGAFEKGAGGLQVADVTKVTVGDGELYRHAFSFKVGETTVEGQRTIWTKNQKIERDVWVPNSPADPSLAERVAAASTALDDAFNGVDGAAVSNMYATNTTVVLTSGKTMRGEEARTFVSAAAPTVSNMTSVSSAVFMVGPDHAASESVFSATLTMDGKEIPLAGERLVLWNIAGETPTVVAEISWPVGDVVKK